MSEVAIDYIVLGLMMLAIIMNLLAAWFLHLNIKRTFGSDSSRNRDSFE
tara:strand:- start:37870 stop:38016 length:147 start_codon:yes stop_codon:yes gene_type:complete